MLAVSEVARPFDSPFGRSLRAFSLRQWLAMSEPSARRRRDEGESNGGGGGSRTRVRKHVLVGLYMRSRFCFLVPGVRKRLKTAGHQPRFISRSRAGPPRDRQPV